MAVSLSPPSHYALLTQRLCKGYHFQALIPACAKHSYPSSHIVISVPVLQRAAAGSCNRTGPSRASPQVAACRCFGSVRRCGCCGTPTVPAVLTVTAYPSEHTNSPTSIRSPVSQRCGSTWSVSYPVWTGVSPTAGSVLHTSHGAL